MHACLRCPNIPKLEIKPDFPSLGDEIAEPHPYMNINVAAFTESEKSSNTIAQLKFSYMLSRMSFHKNINCEKQISYMTPVKYLL